MTPEGINEYRVTVKVRNNLLLRAIEAAGGSPGQKWCRQVGLTYSTVNQLINMTESPVTTKGELTKTAVRLCEVTGCLPEELWSSDQVRPLEKNFTELEITGPQLEQLMSAGPLHLEADLDRFELPLITDRLLEKLTEREEAVLRLRFGIGCSDDHTYEEVGKALDLSLERVRQIEKKAFRKIRSHNLADDLREHVNG